MCNWVNLNRITWETCFVMLSVISSTSSCLLHGATAGTSHDSSRVSHVSALQRCELLRDALSSSSPAAPAKRQACGGVNVHLF